MGALDLLHQLRGDGLVLTLTPVGGLHVAPRSALTDAHRAAIRAERDGLALALQAEASWAPPPRRSGNPLMTPEQGDACHAGEWDDDEIDTFTARQARFTRMGRAADAEHLAERLTLRDREGDDRRLCLECTHLTGRVGAGWRCGNAQVAGVGQELLADVVALLRRCPGYQM